MWHHLAPNVWLLHMVHELICMNDSSSGTLDMQCEAVGSVLSWEQFLLQEF